MEPPLNDDEKDSWGTPPEVYNYLNRRFKFLGDMAASDTNKLHLRVWFTKERSAFDVCWTEEMSKIYNIKIEPRAPRFPSIMSFFVGKKRKMEQVSDTEQPPFVFINPQYSCPERWLAKAVQECDRGLGSVLLLKEQDGEEYWSDHVDGKVSEIIHITGRLAFLHPRTRKPVKGTNFGSCIVIYDPRHEPGSPAKTFWIRRNVFYQL